MGEVHNAFMVTASLFTLCRYLNDVFEYVVAQIEERDKNLRIHAYVGRESQR